MIVCPKKGTALRAVSFSLQAQIQHLIHADMRMRLLRMDIAVLQRFLQVSARGMFHMPKLLASACVDAAGLICKRRAGYDFTEASCIPSLRHTVIPMLFIHGGKDRMVSPRFLDMNYNACSSIDRERLLVPDADHMESSAVDPKRYWDTVYGFIRRSFKI